MGRIAVASAVVLWLIPISILVNQIVPSPDMAYSSWEQFLLLRTRAPLQFYASPMEFWPFYVAFLFMRYSCILDRLSMKKRQHCKLWLFLYILYTDVASLTAVLVMYLLALKKKYLLSSLLGALSVLIRQTNIIWTLFVACTSVIQFAESHNKSGEEIKDMGTSMKNNDLYSSQDNVSVATNLRKRRGNKVITSHKSFTPQTSVPMAHSSGLVDEILDIIVISWNHFWEIFVSLSPFFMVFVAFLGFVYWNGSIVLGAKDAHGVSLHFPQLLYFGLISAIFTAPVQFKKLLKRKLFGPVQLLVALAFGFLSVQFFSIAHPYLLADSRHYTFYLWRKVINYHWSTKYLMIPLYVYSWFSIVDNLG
ncbi:Dol-P-Glc:Glc(2)Man(9)GlcNAc(2)-PP-Dol alpha-1,2-glucosyltransferase [Striga asiatica]|uniref:Dol-P-Glc:Glc(2)Man(9)GlcNAc(2)-PP-Dol alpha-1,2-glucosyltransferase n=1 Tax=Striga asiatica TaxID=4170 RepID=A0A5A7RAQ4_STRAF|nr:Dol-P-Glc:Glc(2)Man(9)GlcNAc(2)-PP-Dol alpha-1,2-glucosyltransferase [Striga asiatica]